MIGAVYEAGVATVGRDEILAARAEGAAESLDVVATDAECASIADRLLDATDGVSTGSGGRCSAPCAVSLFLTRRPAGSGGRPSWSVSIVEMGILPHWWQPGSMPPKRTC